MKRLAPYIGAFVLAIGVHILIGLSAQSPDVAERPKVQPQETSVLIRFIRPAAPDEPVSAAHPAPAPASASVSRSEVPSKVPAPAPATAAVSPMRTEAGSVAKARKQNGTESAEPSRRSVSVSESFPPRQAAVGILPPTPTIPIVPEYPRIARLRGYEGLVQIRALIDENGRVVRAEVVTSSGHAILDSAARGAVESASFTPARNGENPTEYTLLVPVRFSLSDR